MSEIFIPREEHTSWLSRTKLSGWKAFIQQYRDWTSYNKGYIGIHIYIYTFNNNN